ncbi:citrate/2-methylcitrate synthase [Deinococcus radiotolerans]|uniref:citrate synthase (unknown stereospecificity) n=1 Tax=Deinococcus radiotolerans TaxID=1309407 RepID=A0ABQ2FPY6_9DEIO|nr:citrate synthase family protein [Deinococcus radiotolerans]GGL15417.1 citrate synthase [Deinococcus radiotolerans]
MTGPLTTAQACEQLGVKPATLYAYVSRGLIRSVPGPAGTRERRYDAGDVQAFAGRQATRRDPQASVQAAVQGSLDGLRGAQYGGVTPILDSALTRIENGTLAYRGVDARHLAETASAEDVAALLWTGDLSARPTLPLRARLNLSRHPRADTPLEALGYALTYAGAHDPDALDTRPERGPGQTARILSLLHATAERHAGLPPAPDLPLHARLARTWGRPDGADVLRRALILLADHELNVSAFAARVTASGGASLAHCTLAALGALQGPRHGLSALHAHELLSAAQAGDARAALRDATRRAGHTPGFGHALYPHGDPRARALLDALEAQFPAHPVTHATHAVIRAHGGDTAEAPNVDLALASLTLTLGRPAADAVTLFALARAAGWLAHALETRAGGQFIRPRARYVGPA